MGLEKSAENYYLEQKMNSGFEGCTYNFTTNTNTCEGLEFSHSKPEKGILKISRNGLISIAVKFDNMCYIKNGTKSDITSEKYNEETCKAILLAANELEYTTEHNSNITNVEEAIDDLYNMMNNS